jgi:hypothetical protein
MGERVAGMEKTRNTYKMLGGNLKNTDHMEDLGVCKKITLE